MVVNKADGKQNSCNVPQKFGITASYCCCKEWQHVNIPSIYSWHSNGYQSIPRKTQVNHRYNWCLDHIQNVISTFHDATNSSSPQVLARFTLHTVSSAFKNLRERITGHILLASQESSKGCMRGKEKAFESSFVEKQWTLQLGRKDQQSWRPQRGLPERSVSVLRAWMFQNFLHPWVTHCSLSYFGKNIYLNHKKLKRHRIHLIFLTSDSLIISGTQRTVISICLLYKVDWQGAR